MIILRVKDFSAGKYRLTTSQQICILSTSILIVLKKERKLRIIVAFSIPAKKLINVERVKILIFYRISLEDKLSAIISTADNFHVLKHLIFS